MQHIIRFIIITCCLTCTLYGQGSEWIQQSSGTTNWLLGADFIDTVTGWAVGDLGTILKTTNRGYSWIPKSSGITNTVEAIDFIDANTGWAVGDGMGGVILRTTNGGTNWERQDSGRILVSVFFITSTTGWGVGPGGLILKTTNGGTTWTRQTISDSTVFLTSVYFVDSSNGWVIGKFPGTLLRTTNSGSTWTSVTNGIHTGEDFNSVVFLNTRIGWLAGYKFPDTVGVGVIKKTTNGGISWVDRTSGTDQELLSIAFTDSVEGWAVGQGGTILHTTDAGVNWILQSSEVTSELDKIVVRENGKSWIVGLNGTILHNGLVGPDISVSVNVNAGWNMVGVPLAVTDNRKNTIFPTTIGVAYRYDVDLGYQEDDSLDAGVGYWLKFPSAQSISINGLRVDSLTINLFQGWNMVGGITADVPVNNLIQNPPNSIRVVYGFSNEYRIADTMGYGKAYWIKCTADCQVTIQAVLNNNIPKEVLTDITLFNTDELPPPPPEEVMSIRENLAAPAQYVLYQNYPNPFNPMTVIRYRLPIASRVRLKVYDLLGREVATLVDGMQDAGYKSVEWNPSREIGGIVSGIYFYQLTTPSFRDTKKLLLVK